MFVLAIKFFQLKKQTKKKVHIFTIVSEAIALNKLGIFNLPLSQFEHLLFEKKILAFLSQRIP